MLKDYKVFIVFRVKFFIDNREVNKKLIFLCFQNINLFKIINYNLFIMTRITQSLYK
jgi:hypothetical protein